MKMSKNQTCIHSKIEDGKFICDISDFEVDGTHCAGCASYENADDYQVCDSCKNLVKKENVHYYGNECICEECITNGYGE